MNDIIQEIRSGNKAAVKAVYQKYAKDVYNFAKSITGDHDSALFATKKTFSILFNNIKKGDEPTNLRTAALKIAYDEAYNAATAQKSPDGSTDAYAESESPANKTYLKPKNIENNSYNSVDDGSNNYSYDDSYNNYNNVRNSRSSSRTQNYQEPAYEDDYNDSYQDDYDVPGKSRYGKQNPAVYNAFDDEDQYDDYDDNYDNYDDYDGTTEKHRNKGLFVFCIIINVILILILLWFLCGLLVNLGVLPNINLGYTWFNSHIYPLF